MAVDNDEGLLIIEIDGAWEVWCGADGENIINAHLIAVGPTRDAAVTKAVKSVEALLERLQAPA